MKTDTGNLCNLCRRPAHTAIVSDGTEYSITGDSNVHLCLGCLRELANTDLWRMWQGQLARLIAEERACKCRG